MKRVVADSNIFVSALQFGGKPMALLTLAEEGQIDLAISEAILTETLGVPQRPMLSEAPTTCTRRWIWRTALDRYWSSMEMTTRLGLMPTTHR